MDLAKRLALVIPVLALLACGGSVVKVGPGAGDGGGDDGPSNGCPSLDVVGGGAACSDPGQTCMGTVSFDECGSGQSVTTQCTCASGTWQCPVAFSGACPAPTVPCPIPSAITPGGSCTTSSYLSCSSDIAVQVCNGDPSDGTLQCICNDGAWNCAEGTPVCVIEAGGACPPPGNTFQGQACDEYGITCGGDEQFCGGGPVYDALQCQNGVWTVVASTFCDADGGVDAEFGDAGQGI
jgi:hypothetical protein